MAEAEQRREDSASSEVEVKTVVDSGVGPSTEGKESAGEGGKKNPDAEVLTPEEPSKVASSGVGTASGQEESPDSKNNDNVEISEGQPTSATKPSGVGTASGQEESPDSKNNDTIEISEVEPTSATKPSGVGTASGQEESPDSMNNDTVEINKGEPTSATKPNTIDTKENNLGDKEPKENENDTVSLTLRTEENVTGDKTEDHVHEPELENTASEVKDEPEQALDADDHKHEIENNDVEENKTRSEDAASETNQSPLDILKLPGTDADKFKRLSELLSAGEISSKDFVNNVLGVITGRQFDLDSDFVIADGNKVLLMIDLLDGCPAKLQAELWSLLSAGVRRSTTNVQLCVAVGLAEKILTKIESYDDMLAEILIDLLGVLGSFSISVKELQMIFSYLKARNGKWPRHSMKLLKVLHQMPLQSGPNAFFTFPGIKGSVIALPPLSKWPVQNGWTFHCWFRMDPVMGVINNREKPYIFCFRTGKGIGYSGHFFGNAFVITVVKVKGKGFQHCVKYDFQPREWNMVTIAFVYNRWMTSELNCYVNGKFVSHAEMSWPVNTSDVFDKCYLGSSAEMDEETMFCGQMSSVYLFSEVLQAQQVEALYMLGPGHCSQLKFESDVALSDDMKQVLYDGKLSASIVFLYSPVACDGQLCLDSAPKGNQSFFMHSPHALILGETKPCVTHSIYSSLHSVGGVQVLFSLFEQLDLVEETEPGVAEKVNYTICTSLVRLLCKLLFGSNAIQQQLLQCKGFLVLGFLLEKSSKQHLTTEVLDAFASMATCLLANPASGLILLKHLFDSILLNPNLWICASVEVQRNLYSILLNFLNVPENPVAAYRISYIVHTMHKLMYYYWVVDPTERSNISLKEIDGPRPSREDILELRGLMLQSIKLLVKAESKIEDEELQSISSYLITVQEDENLLDVLELLVQLVSEVPASLVPAFDRIGGIKFVFKLLDSPDEKIRIQALKLLGFFLARSMAKRKQDSMGPYNLYTLITEKLMLHSTHITVELYSALFEILTEHPTLNFTTDEHQSQSISYRIENPLILKVIAQLIHPTKQRHSTNELRKLFLSDLRELLLKSRENRRIILQMSVWQEWLLSLAYIHPQNEEEHNITDMVLGIFNILLFHAVKLEVGGWRVWIDTQAILHSRVSFEEFRIKASKFYRQHSKTAESLPRQQPSGVEHAGAESHHVREDSKCKEGKSENDVDGAAAAFVNDVADSAVSVVTGKEQLNAVSEGGAETLAAEQKQQGKGNLQGSTPSVAGKSGRRPMNAETERHVFSPGPRTPAFTIPEFRWTALHVKLLKDLFASFESELEAWKTHTTRTIIEFVNAPENQVFTANLTQIVSQLSDNLISSCGGLLPLLAAATSNLNEVEGSEPGHGMSIVTASDFLQRVVAMIDILIFASNLNLSNLEQEKMMNSGGILRQSLRLVCTGIVRGCLENRLYLQAKAGGQTAVENTDRKIVDFIRGSYSSNNPSFDPVNILSLISTKDGEKLIQDMDISRLRAVVYRNAEETKQSEYLALTIVYFVCVLMVSKYRDILEPVPPSSSKRPSRSSLADSTSNGEEIQSKSSPAVAAQPDITKSPTEAKDAKVDEEDSENKAEGGGGGGGGGEGEAEKLADAVIEKSNHSEEISENASVSEISTDVTKTEIPSEDTKEIVSISSADPSEQPTPSDSGRDVQLHEPLTQDSLPKSMEIKTTPQEESGKLTDKLQQVLGSLAPLVREIFVDFAAFLSRTLLGSHGQELLPGGMHTLKQSASVVELVMLLCSQEWQNSLQKFAGLAFVELVNEGRLSSAATNDHTVRVANEAEFILKRLRADDIQKHTEFQTVCKKVFHEKSEEMKLCDHLITSSHVRDRIVASQQCQKVRDILALGRVLDRDAETGRKLDFWKLDKWEDDSRRRRRLIKDPNGQSHSSATFHAPAEATSKEEPESNDKESLKYELNYTQLPRVTSPDSVTDEEVMQTDDQDISDLSGVAMSTPCRMIAPGAVIHGMLSITKTELYFEVNQEDPRNKLINPKVLQYIDYQHSKWHFRDIRAIFSRKYRHQNSAIEIFVSSRTAIMFAFDDFAVVKRVVGALPRVGVGVKYGLPQTRRVSLASPRQIFKMSNMTRRWQQNEVSNFDYLMFINTVAGRTYCDLSQYPVYPWIIANYDSPDLDLSLVTNYRDFSKPVGALNPMTRDFLEEQFNSMANSKMPPHHYSTHYSTASSTLDWLVRLEPFTTFYLDHHDGKFAHPNKMFHSVVNSWRNCFLDVGDVKELIPEFFYLPEMFVNMNDLDLGTNAEGQNISNVELPPWAKTPEDFVRIMRMALESEIVSSQLNQWIDLVFGYRQRGPESVRALNVFHHLTYEGSVNWDAINDSATRQALEDQITSLGLTPSQLLTEPHPPRSPGLSPASLPPLMPSAVRDDVCLIMKFLSNSPVVHVSANTHPSVPVPAVVTVTANYNFAVNKWDHAGASTQGPQPSYKEGAVQALQLPLAMDPLLGLNRRSLGDEAFDLRVMAKHATFVVTADNRFILAGGFANKSFRVFNTESGKVCQIIYGHYDLVTCICRSECGISQDCYVVTGSRDCTVMVWHWTAKQQMISGDGNNPTQAVSKATLIGHQSEVTCVIVSSELGIIISGSQSGPVLMHCISGELVRCFCPPTEAAASCTSPKLLALSREGSLFISYDKGGICSFGINGNSLGYLPHEDNIQSMIVSRDGQFLILGGHSGSVRVWRSHDLGALYAYPACDSPIQSLVLSHDHRYLMAGLASGCLVVFNIDFTKWLQEIQKLC